MAENLRNPYIGMLVLLLSAIAIYDIYVIVSYILGLANVSSADYMLHMKLLIFVTFLMVLLFVFRNLVFKLKKSE